MCVFRPLCERLRILPQFPQGRLIPPTQIVSRSALPSTPVVAEIPTEIPPPPLSAPPTTSPCSSGTQQPSELLPEMSHVISRASPPNPSRHGEFIRLPHNLVDVNLSRRHDSGVEVREKDFLRLGTSRLKTSERNLIRSHMSRYTIKRTCLERFFRAPYQCEGRILAMLKISLRFQLFLPSTLYTTCE